MQLLTMTCRWVSQYSGVTYRPKTFALLALASVGVCGLSLATVDTAHAVSRKQLNSMLYKPQPGWQAGTLPNGANAGKYRNVPGQPNLRPQGGNIDRGASLGAGTPNFPRQPLPPSVNWQAQEQARQQALRNMQAQDNLRAQEGYRRQQQADQAARAQQQNADMMKMNQQQNDMARQNQINHQNTMRAMDKALYGR